MPNEMMVYELDQLQSCADRFHETVSTLESIDENLKRIFGDDSSSWKGKAADEFSHRIEKTYDKFSEILEQYRQEHEKLASAIAVYRIKEGLINNEVVRLATEDIF